MTNPVECHSRPHENGESGESREGYLAYYPIIYLTFIKGAGGEAEKSYIQSQAKAGTEARWFYDSRIIKDEN